MQDFWSAVIESWWSADGSWHFRSLSIINSNLGGASLRPLLSDSVMLFMSAQVALEAWVPEEQLYIKTEWTILLDEVTDFIHCNIWERGFFLVLTDRVMHYSFLLIWVYYSVISSYSIVYLSKAWRPDSRGHSDPVPALDISYSMMKPQGLWSYHKMLTLINRFNMQ